MRQDIDLWICPDCGAEVEVGARGCPRCLERERRQRKSSGVRRHGERDDIYDGLDLPDDEFDYEKFVAREFGHKPHRRVGIAWYWWLTAAGVLALLALAASRGLR